MLAFRKIEDLTQGTRAYQYGARCEKVTVISMQGSLTPTSSLCVRQSAHLPQVTIYEIVVNDSYQVIRVVDAVQELGASGIVIIKGRP